MCRSADFLTLDGSTGGMIEAGSPLGLGNGGFDIGIERRDSGERRGSLVVLKKFGGTGSHKANGWAVVDRWI